jgi:3-hydroxyisobutyrate dehydrogenase-like beta-hydroxyacid dehydrogenase
VTASVTEAPRVAVIAVGRMAARMTRRLMAAGHEVTVCDASVAAIQKLCADGAACAEVALARYREAQAADLGELDDSAVARLFEQMSDIWTSLDPSP